MPGGKYRHISGHIFRLDGIEVCAPVHDALLIEADDCLIEATVQITQECMTAASRDVLDGFELRSDAKIVRHPERYMDPRGERMWGAVQGILADVRQQSETAAMATTGEVF